MSQISIIAELKKRDVSDDLLGTYASFNFLMIWYVILSLII